MNHVNLYKKGESEKHCCLWCDPLAGPTGRYSMIHYNHRTNGNAYFGMLLSIMFYGVKEVNGGENYYLTAVVARLIVSSSTADKCVFPMPLYKFDKSSDQRFVFDQIEFNSIITPLFFVAHGVNGVAINSNVVDIQNRFYVFSPDVATCEHRISYEQYVLNNRVISNRNRKVSVLDLNMFMTIEEMVKLKESLFVAQKIIPNRKNTKVVIASKDIDVLHDSDVESSNDNSNEEDNLSNTSNDYNSPIEDY